MAWVILIIAALLETGGAIVAGVIGLKLVTAASP
jgi:hypothetical protein